MEPKPWCVVEVDWDARTLTVVGTYPTQEEAEAAERDALEKIGYAEDLDSDLDYVATPLYPTEKI